MAAHDAKNPMRLATLGTGLDIAVSRPPLRLVADTCMRSICLWKLEHFRHAVTNKTSYSSIKSLKEAVGDRVPRKTPV